MPAFDRRFTCSTLLWVVLLTFVTGSQAKDLLWSGCGISKLAFMQDLAAAYKAKTGINLILEGGGATKGIRSVASRHSALGGSCRMPLIFSDGEGGYRVHGEEGGVAMIPLGWDALTPLVHPSNPWVQDITLDQLRDVLTGRITHWFQFNPDAPVDRAINLYVRSGRISGVGLTLRQQLFNDPEQVFSPGARQLPSSGKIEQAVEEDVDAFGVSGISSSRHRKVRLLSLNGLEPSLENLQKGKYALYRILFLTAPFDYKQQSDVRAFVEFALSTEGQKVIRSAGTLPYHYGLNLLRTSASDSYLQSLEVLELSGLYLPNG